MDISTSIFSSESVHTPHSKDPVIARIEVPAPVGGGYSGVMELRTDIPVLEHHLHNEPLQPHEPDFEALMERAFLLAQEHDRICWRLGDLFNILLADTRPGRPADQRLTRAYLASRLQMSTSKVEDLQKVASRFPSAVRGDIPPNLGIAHLRTIARRVDDLETALEWVNMASDNDWTVDRLASELSHAMPTDPKPPVRTESHHMPLADIPSLFPTIDRQHARRIEVSYHPDGKVVMVVLP